MTNGSQKTAPDWPVAAMPLTGTAEQVVLAVAPDPVLFLYTFSFLQNKNV